MINTVHGNSQWLNVQAYPGNKPYMNTTQPSSGMVRYNSNVYGGALEVYDGNMWQQIGNGSVNVDLNENVKQTIVWAEKKMQEEVELKDMMKRHPGLRDLHDKFEMMKILCQEEDENNA